MKVILASKSPRRKKVLKTLGIKFEVIPSNFDENSIKGLEKNPPKLVESLAIEKAKVVAKKNPNDLIIGADNMVALDGKVIGKPKDLDEARDILRKASGNSLKAYNGIAVIYKKKLKSKTTVGLAKFYKLSERVISKHLKTGDPLDKAGGFAGEPAEGGKLLEKFEGEPGEELGLPLTTLKKFFKELGVKT